MQLKNWSDYSQAKQSKKHLISIRGHQCENCKLSVWMDNQITLEVHHIDGNVKNNNYENLQLLCPNCHSFTENWKGRKSKCESKESYLKLIYYCNCGKEVSRKKSLCRSCSQKQRAFKQPRKVERPTKEELEILIQIKPMTQIAKDYGVSDTSIRKWAK